MKGKYKTLEVHVANGVAAVWLNRPQVRNALNDTLIGELTGVLDALDADASIRAVALAGRGPAFCAGGDLAWARRMGAAASAENIRDAQRMSGLFHRVYSMTKPTVARVHGAAYAGAVGLIAACDIAVASQDAEFCLSEVKIGLAAATILPYLMRSMGERHARRYVLSAEVFTAAEAYRIGLVHELALPQELDAVVDGLLEQLLRGGPAAQSTAKRLFDEVSQRPLTREMVSASAKNFAELRASKEGREGIAAFLEKRAPAWLGGARRAPRKKKGAR